MDLFLIAAMFVAGSATFLLLRHFAPPAAKGPGISAEDYF